jgi:hypothetical protein
MHRFHARKLGGLVAAAALTIAQAAVADPSLQINAFQVESGASVAKVIAATDQLMASAIGKAMPGRLMLFSTIAAGDDPASHSYSILNKSAAEGEAYSAKLGADAAWAPFEAAFDANAKITSATRLRGVRSFGDIRDDDPVWTAVLLRVTDVPKMLAARARYEASATAKKFPGQWHLNAVVAGGANPATHVIHVGYASEAEAESWMATQSASADWQAYIAEIQDVSQVLGTTMHRLVKSWGSATTKDLVAR